MKRITVIIFAILLCVMALTYPASALEAANITKSTRISSAGNEGQNFLLLDSSRTTGISISSEQKITIENKYKIKHLYLVWNSPHTTWDLVTTQNGQEYRKTCGKDGFLHEYVELDKAEESVTLEFRGGDQILCDIYAFAEGDVLPEWVEIWQPPHADADLLLLPARVGDEFLYFGGTIPYYSTLKQKKVQIAFMTNVWEKPDYTHEMLNGLYDSGYRAYPIISNFPEVTASDLDGALQVYSEDDFIGYTIEMLRRFKPEVVLGQGEYGDGTQLLCTQTLSIATELSANDVEYRDSAKKYGAWDVPKTYLHAYSDKRTVMDWNVAIPTLGGNTALTAAKNSFSFYTWRKPRKLEVTGTYDCRSFGLKRSTVGGDALANDFFENIVYTSENPKIVPAVEIVETPQPVLEVKAPEPAVLELQNAPKPSPPPKINPLIMGGVAAFCVIVALLLRLKKD